MTSILRVIKFGFLNFLRNPWLSIATTFIFALTLFIVSVFFFLNLVTQTTIKAVQDKMDLTITFKDEATEADIFNLKDQLESYPYTKSIKYISKEEAIIIWQQLPLSKRVKDLVTQDKNPLPRSLQIKVNNPEDLEKINTFISNKKWKPLIRENGISYQKNKTIIERLNNITKFVEKVGVALALIFLGISILVIFNTVRLNILSRKDEIEIQRLVGATNWFIQAPFLVEGILYGLLATGLSVLFIYLLIHYTTPLIAKYLGEVSFNLDQFFISNLFLIFAIQFLIGVFVGSICSLISIKKYLKV